jgi:hypothetical protein
LNDDCDGAVTLTPGATFEEYPVVGTMSAQQRQQGFQDLLAQHLALAVTFGTMVVVPDDGNITFRGA